MLTEGVTVVIAGRPNAGKSTLLNRLAGHDAAIVSATPGTTRDLLRERILIDGLPLHLIDTAGLRRGGDDIEAEGMRRARAAMAQADRVLFLVDVVADPTAASLADLREELPASVPSRWSTTSATACPGPGRRTPSALPLRRDRRGARRAARAPQGDRRLERGGGGVVSARARHSSRRSPPPRRTCSRRGASSARAPRRNSSPRSCGSRSAGSS
ncbi:MAG: GTPase [Steroidobacteraceae bacterium]